MELSAFAGFDGALLLTPVIVGLVEVAKRLAPFLGKGPLALLSVLVGLALGWYLTLALGLNPWEQLWWGGLAGLAGTNSYKLGKAALRWERKVPPRG